MIWPFIILSYISLFAVGLCDNIRGPLFPEILKEFALTDGQGSWMFAISSFCGFWGSSFCKHFLKKWNHLVLLDFSLLVMTLGLWGLALSHHYWVLLLASCLTGFSMGSLGVAQNVLVNKGTPIVKRRQTLSGLHAMYGISSLLAPLLVAGVSLLFSSWRWTFAASSMIPFSILIYSLICKPRVETRDLNKQPTDHAKKSHKIAWDQVFLACALGTYVVAEIMISSRLALFVRREQSANLEISTLYVAGFFLMLLFGRLLFTWKSFPWTLKKQLQWALMFSLFSTVVGIFIHPLFLVLVGLFMAPIYPLSIAYISEIFPNKLDSAISYTMAAQSLLIVVMHTSVGYLTDWYGMTSALFVGPVFLFISFMILSSFQKLFKVET